jgi:hypothetical protein
LDAVGGLLIVTTQFTKEGTETAPYITVVAAPSQATLGTLDSTFPPGHTYSDFWDDDVLSPDVFPDLPGPHCPFMAAAEGFPRKVKLPGIVDLLTNSQPLFFPY